MLSGRSRVEVMFCCFGSAAQHEASQQQQQQHQAKHVSVADHFTDVHVPKAPQAIAVQQQGVHQAVGAPCEPKHSARPHRRDTSSEEVSVMDVHCSWGMMALVALCPLLVLYPWLSLGRQPLPSPPLAFCRHAGCYTKILRAFMAGGWKGCLRPASWF